MGCGSENSTFPRLVQRKLNCSRLIRIGRELELRNDTCNAELY